MGLFHPGGGEIQILKYQEYLDHRDYKYKSFDGWSSLLPEHCSAFHYFSCMGGSEHLLRQVNNQNIPIILSTSLWLTDHTVGLYDLNLISSIFSTVDTFITNGFSESENLSRIFDIPLSRFKVVRNGCDDKFFDLYNRGSAMSSNDAKTVLCLGNIEERKRQLELVQAVSQLTDVSLLLAGNIRSKSYFSKIQPYLGEKIKYLGPYNHLSDFHLSLLAIADLFVLPSTLETPGLAALEAAASGLPILITSEGSTREYFQNYAEYVHPSLSPSELASSIYNAVNTLSPVPKSHIEQFQWSACVNQLINIYNMYG